MVVAAPPEEDQAVLLERAVPENVNAKLEHTYGTIELGPLCLWSMLAGT